MRCFLARQPATHELAAGVSHGLSIPGIDSLILAGLVTSKTDKIYTTNKYMIACKNKTTPVILTTPTHNRANED